MQKGVKSVYTRRDCRDAFAEVVFKSPYVSYVQNTFIVLDRRGHAKRISVAYEFPFAPTRFSFSFPQFHPLFYPDRRLLPEPAVASRLLIRDTRNALGCCGTRLTWDCCIHLLCRYVRGGDARESGGGAGENKKKTATLWGRTKTTFAPTITVSRTDPKKSCGFYRDRPLFFRRIPKPVTVFYCATLFRRTQMVFSCRCGPQYPVKPPTRGHRGHDVLFVVFSRAIGWWRPGWPVSRAQNEPNSPRNLQRPLFKRTI